MDEVIMLFENDGAFQFLKRYYTNEDFATKYGVDRSEIKHSNFLSWFFDPARGHGLDDFAIRKLLEYLLDKDIYSDELKQAISSKVYSLRDIEVYRENNNIDILIVMVLNDTKVRIVIENKVNAILDDNQLDKYRNYIESKSQPSDENIYLYLHPNYNDETNKAKQSGFHSITFQEVYENILLPAESIATNYETKISLQDYVHCLAKPVFDDTGLIITDAERNSIQELITKYRDCLLEVTNAIINKETSSPYYKLYDKEKETFVSIFNKCVGSNASSIVFEIDKELEDSFKLALNKKIYSFNGESCRGIRDFVYKVLNYLIHEKGKTYEDLEDLINITGVNKLIATEEQMNDKNYVNTPRYYDDRIHTIDFGDGVKYYVYNAWYSNDYLKLKEDMVKACHELKDVIDI